MKKTQYYDLPELKHLYLEDSFVLDIKEENNYVEFLIEAVLSEEHPLYKTPLKSKYAFLMPEKLSG